jgi:hypothetical protein
MGGAAGGTLGSPTPGTALQGGNGGVQGGGDGGGGGGGGYFGGGGGSGANSDAFSGGGGSGFVHASATGIVLTTGNQASPAREGDSVRMNAGDVNADGAVLVDCM